MTLSRAKLSRTRRKRLHCRLSIFGIGDSNKIHCGIQKNATYLDGKRDLTATREAGFTKIWTRNAGNVLPVCREFEECGNCESTRREQWCLLCYLVSHFVSFALFTRFAILRYERLFRFCNGLRTHVNSKV